MFVSGLIRAEISYSLGPRNCIICINLLVKAIRRHPEPRQTVTVTGSFAADQGNRAPAQYKVLVRARTWKRITVCSTYTTLALTVTNLPLLKIINQHLA